MKSLTSSLFGAFALSLAAMATAHAQATIDDCEKIQAADAYNQCLAKFGPESKVKSVEPERPGDVKASGSEAAAAAGPARGRGRHRGHASRGGGRRHISFTVRRRHK